MHRVAYITTTALDVVACAEFWPDLVIIFHAKICVYFNLDFNHYKRKCLLYELKRPLWNRPHADLVSTDNTYLDLWDLSISDKHTRFCRFLRCYGYAFIISSYRIHLIHLYIFLRVASLELQIKGFNLIVFRHLVPTCVQLQMQHRQ